MSAGVASPAASVPSSSTRPAALRWSGRVPRETIAAGVAGSSPAETSPCRDPVSSRKAHEEDERAAGCDERLVVGLGTIFVTGGGERHAIGHTPMRDRNAGRAGNRCDRREPWDDLDLDPRLPQRERFLAAASEHERVAALEPHHVEPERAVADEQLVDGVLVATVAADDKSLRRRLRDESFVHERVVDEDLAGANPRQCPDGHELGISRSGADEMNRQENAFSTSPSKYALRSS